MQFKLKSFKATVTVFKKAALSKGTIHEVQIDIDNYCFKTDFYSETNVQVLEKLQEVLGYLNLHHEFANDILDMLETLEGSA